MKKIFNKKLKESSKKWIARNIDDIYVKQKKIQGFRSRSAFKLLEIDKKFKLLNNSSYILDLGSSPGSWSQILAKKIKNGKILASDIMPMEKIDNVHFILGDFLNETIQEKIFKHFDCKIDTIISDMAANTTGSKDLDSLRTSELCLNAMEFSKNILNKNGVFLSKFFMGSSFSEIRKKAKIYFKKVVFYKPNSSRKESRELYIFCKNIIN